MIEPQLQTERLTLVLQTIEHPLAQIEERSPEDRAHMSPDGLARRDALPFVDPWMPGFQWVQRESAAVALGSSQTRVVRAHALPEPNASTRVLTKCGFRFLGEVIDPEDGLVWRWEKVFEASAT